jgi:alpha-methylacyl-CoA racemase
MKIGSQGPLDGVRIIEMEGLGPVPFCGMLLADMGAEILTVAAPPSLANALPEQRESHRTDPVWRGRCRLTLDLKDTATAAGLVSITPYVEVLIEGFRPGVMERLGLGPDACHTHNPKLVYGRMTGWGQTGPLAAAPGHDVNYLAVTGALHTFGYADRPPTQPLNLVGDLGGGALYLAIGVLAAVIQARATGIGQVVDAAMIDGIASMMTGVAAVRAAGKWNDTRYSNRIDGGAPYNTVYETRDGKHIAIAAVEDKFWNALIEKLALSPLDLPDRQNRANWAALRQRLSAVFMTQTRDEWAAQLEGSDACVSPVLGLTEAASHPHNMDRDVFIERNGRQIPRSAPRFSTTPSALAPQQGIEPAELFSAWRVPDETARFLLSKAQFCS